MTPSANPATWAACRPSRTPTPDRDWQLGELPDPADQALGLAADRIPVPVMPITDAA